MRIEISKENRRPVIAEQSSKLASELGIIARNILPVPTKWKELSEEDKNAALERLNTKFTIDMGESYVKDSCEDLLKLRSKDERFRYHQRFKKHNSVEAARQDKPVNISQDDWNHLVDLFADPKYQKRCTINKENRAKQTTTHHEGSKPFVVVRHEKRNIETDEEPNRIEFHRMIHCRNSIDWDSEENQAKYNQMKQMETQAASEGRQISSDEIADRVLGVRSGRIVGLGHGPKPIGSTSQKQRNYELEEALKKANTNNATLLESNAMLLEQLNAMILKQASFEKTLESLMAGRSVSSPSFTP